MVTPAEVNELPGPKAKGKEEHCASKGYPQEFRNVAAEGATGIGSGSRQAR